MAHRDGARVPTIVTFSVGVSSQDTSAGPERELRTVLNLISHLTCKADDHCRVGLGYQPPCQPTGNSISTSACASAMWETN